MSIQDFISWICILGKEPSIESNGFLCWMDFVTCAVVKSEKARWLIKTSPSHFPLREIFPGLTFIPTYHPSRGSKIKIVSSPNYLILQVCDPLLRLLFLNCHKERMVFGFYFFLILVKILDYHKLLQMKKKLSYLYCIF
mgnify:CR=1 FL=1